VLSHGNFLWCNWGKVRDGVFRSKSEERLNGAQTLESDNITALKGLVADPFLFDNFFLESLKQNPTHMNLEHRRRGFLLDRLWDLVGLQKAFSQGEESLRGAVVFFKQQTNDALHRENLWDPSKYSFLTDEPLKLKY